LRAGFCARREQAVRWGNAALPGKAAADDSLETQH